MNQNISVIIPAYKPDASLLHTIRELSDAGFRDIIVVDDGGGSAYAPIFDEVAANPACTLLRHEVNRGKGAALKTAFVFFLENRPGYAGVVTADADGQHLPKDILAVAEKMAESGSSVLGVRDFSAPDVPPRSKSGNRITCFMFRLFFGIRITDTQTGLRAFPRDALPVILEAEGDRYEYETNMLYLMDRRKLPLTEVKISTVYIDENNSSHFRVVRDSLRIYGLQLRYLAGYLAGALLFLLLETLLGGIAIPPLASAGIASAAAAVLFYGSSALWVFARAVRVRSFLKFLFTAVTLGLLSVGLLQIAVWIFAPAVPFLRAILWVLLFFLHFRLQHKWVFR